MEKNGRAGRLEGVLLLSCEMGKKKGEAASSRSRLEGEEGWGESNVLRGGVFFFGSKGEGKSREEGKESMNSGKEWEGRAPDR